MQCQHVRELEAYWTDVITNSLLDYLWTFMVLLRRVYVVKREHIVGICLCMTGLSYDKSNWLCPQVFFSVPICPPICTFQRNIQMEIHDIFNLLKLEIVVTFINASIWKTCLRKFTWWPGLLAVDRVARFGAYFPPNLQRAAARVARLGGEIWPNLATLSTWWMCAVMCAERGGVGGGTLALKHTPA